MAVEPLDDVRMDMGALVAAIASRWLRIALITTILLVSCFLILKIVPKQYESSADILVESRESAFTRATNEVRATSGAADPTAISSQIELIKSRDTLLRVIDSEGLRDLPEFTGVRPSLLSRLLALLGRRTSVNISDERVLNIVADKLKVIRQRDSSIISVLFRSSDPDMAAQVANAIAETHIRRRAELSIADTAEASAWLLAEIEKMRVRVSEAESKVAIYRVENDLFVGSNSTSLLDQQLSDIAGQITASQERKNSAKSRAALIQGLLEAGQPIDGVPDVRESVVVQGLSEEKARLQGERALQLATLLPNHPSILALSAQISEINKQILVEGRQVADALDAESSIESGLEASLRDELTRLKVDVSSETRSNVALVELEREAKVQRDLLETYLLRYRDAAARTDSQASLPDVRVITRAAAALRPSSPKKSLILAATGIVALTLQVGYILFAELVTGRALVEVRPTVRREQQFEGLEPVAAQDNASPVADILFGSDKALQNSPPISGSGQNHPTTLRPGTFGAKPAKTIHVANGEDILADLQPLVLVVTLGDAMGSGTAIEKITENLMASGRSVAEIDAGSRQTTAEPGLSDLCAGNAEFGDVVHRGNQLDFAMVPWGTESAFDAHSKKCRTLIKALSEIFETVLVDVGRAGMMSALPALNDLEAQVLLLVESDADIDMVERVRADIEDLGFSNCEIVTPDIDYVKVA